MKTRVDVLLDNLVNDEIKQSRKVISPASLQNEMKYVFVLAKEHYKGIPFPQCSGVGGIKRLRETSNAFNAALLSAANITGGSISSDTMKVNPIFYADKENLVEACSFSAQGLRDIAVMEFLYQTGLRPGNMYVKGCA